jgi:hypothetical protein
MSNIPIVGDIISPYFNVGGYPIPSIEYQWLKNGDDIIGASGITYEILSVDIDSNIGVRVTMSNIYGEVNSFIYFTNSSESIVEFPVFTTMFSIVTSTENPQVGVPITIDQFNVSPPEVSIQYTWYCDDDEIALANQSTYIPVEHDIGCMIKLRITLTNNLGSVFSESIISEPVVDQQLSGSFVSIDTPV